MSGDNEKIKRGLERKEIIDRNGVRTKRWVRRDDGGASDQNGIFNSPAALRIPRGSAAPTSYTGEPVRSVVGDRVEYKTPDGLLHRVGEPAVIYRDKDGSERVEYWENGQLTYRSMPGLVHNGTLFHRYDGTYCSFEGPAIVRPDGRKEFYLWGVKMKSYADVQRGIKLGRGEFLTRYGALAVPPPTLNGIANSADASFEDDGE